ncbi:MAG: hypothetical protein FJ108_02890 [Deltaproteobacteria bacterium]|nr:hypothetical protein [Deltaproteobacteria bacterium]
MDLLLIIRDALASSLAGALLTALQAREAGRTVAVLLTQEALEAAARGSFGWPRELSGPTIRLGIADRAAAQGLPLLGRGAGRQLDAKGLFSRAERAGVELYACPVWTTLLGLEESLPPGMRRLDGRALIDLLRNAGRVIGSL